ncbi:MAG: acetyl-CoA carboxylase biotin carboxyl carrier protein [Verrucomicrobiales bacterium]|nr:acetyl-CoA carboxylase biotin carboxyl carrier protein [Verrucomicrobiales bacterium]
MDLKDIKAIIDLMRKNAISEFELERQDFKIRLKRGGNGGSPITFDDTGALSSGSAAAISATLPAASAAKGAENASGALEIKSPMIGTLYRSPSPDSSPYADVGTEVSPDTVVCIIEAMKVMNEIKAEVRGVITQVLVDNAKPVEFGQPLFKVRPL